MFDKHFLKPKPGFLVVLGATGTYQHPQEGVSSSLLGKWRLWVTFFRGCFKVFLGGVEVLGLEN